MPIIDIPLCGRAYDIVIDAGIFAAGRCEQLQTFVTGRRCLIASDSNVLPIYGSATRAMLEAAGAARVSETNFPAGEESKSLATLAGMVAAGLAAGLDRKSIVIALGGGVVGDTAGFMAASYMRGIDLIQMPTSLVAHVDSSIGGKTGVDLPAGKNLIGAFHQPRLVLIDVDTLLTLSPRDLRCGLAEVVKYGLILDVGFFQFLEENIAGLLGSDPAVYEHVIERCCQLKADIILEDEFETGRRAILNYGHTFGHALEKLTAYVRFTHGEAIAVGMGMAAELACLLDETASRRELMERQDRIFAALGLPRSVSGIEPAEVAAAMTTDKKYVHGRNRLILPNRIGEVGIVSDVSEALILEAIGGRCDQS